MYTHLSTTARIQAGGPVNLLRDRALTLTSSRSKREVEVRAQRAFVHAVSPDTHGNVSVSCMASSDVELAIALREA